MCVRVRDSGWVGVLVSPIVDGARSHKRGGSTEDKGTPQPKKKPGDPDYDPYDFDSDDEGT